MDRECDDGNAIGFVCPVRRSISRIGHDHANMWRDDGRMMTLMHHQFFRLERRRTDVGALLWATTRAFLGVLSPASIS